MGCVPTSFAKRISPRRSAPPSSPGAWATSDFAAAKAAGTRPMSEALTPRRRSGAERLMNTQPTSGIHERNTGLRMDRGCGSNYAYTTDHRPPTALICGWVSGRILVMQQTAVPNSGVRELALNLRQATPPQTEKAVLLAELGDGYAIPQVSIRRGLPSQEESIEVTFEFAEQLQDFWEKHVSPTGAAWIALSLSLDKSGFVFQTFEIPEFGRRSQREVRACILASCFASPTTDDSVRL